MNSFGHFFDQGPARVKQESRQGGATRFERHAALEPDFFKNTYTPPYCNKNNYRGSRYCFFLKFFCCFVRFFVFLVVFEYLYFLSPFFLLPCGGVYFRCRNGGGAEVTPRRHRNCQILMSPFPADFYFRPQGFRK